MVIWQDVLCCVSVCVYVRARIGELNFHFLDYEIKLN